MNSTFAYFALLILCFTVLFPVETLGQLTACPSLNYTQCIDRRPLLNTTACSVNTTYGVITAATPYSNSNTNGALRTIINEGDRILTASNILRITINMYRATLNSPISFCPMTGGSGFFAVQPGGQCYTVRSPSSGTPVTHTFDIPIGRLLIPANGFIGAYFGTNNVPSFRSTGSLTQQWYINGNFTSTSPTGFTLNNIRARTMTAMSFIAQSVSSGGWFCNANPYCYWSTAANSCRTGSPKTCSQFSTDSVGCLSKFIPTGCNYTNGVCLDSTCGLKYNATTCLTQRPTCVVDYETNPLVCSRPGTSENCSLSTTQSLCEGAPFPGCIWDPFMNNNNGYCFPSKTTSALIYPCSYWNTYTNQYSFSVMQQACVFHGCSVVNSVCVSGTTNSSTNSLTSSYVSSVRITNPNVKMEINGPVLYYTITRTASYQPLNPSYDAVMMGAQSLETLSSIPQRPGYCMSSDYTLSMAARPEYQFNGATFLSYESLLANRTGRLNWNTSMALGVQGLLLRGNMTAGGISPLQSISSTTDGTNKQTMSVRMDLSLMLGAGCVGIVRSCSSPAVCSWTVTTTFGSKIFNGALTPNIQFFGVQSIFSFNQFQNSSVIISEKQRPFINAAIVGVNYIPAGNNQFIRQTRFQMVYTNFYNPDLYFTCPRRVLDITPNPAEDLYGDYAVAVYSATETCTAAFCTCNVILNSLPRGGDLSGQLFNYGYNSSFPSALDGRVSFFVDAYTCAVPAENPFSGTYATWLSQCIQSNSVDVGLDKVSATVLNPFYPALIPPVDSNNITISINGQKMTMTTGGQITWPSTLLLTPNDEFSVSVYLTDVSLRSTWIQMISDLTIQPLDPNGTPLGSILTLSRLAPYFTRYPRQLATDKGCYGTPQCQPTQECLNLGNMNGCDGFSISPNDLAVLGMSNGFRFNPTFSTVNPPVPTNIPFNGGQSRRLLSVNDSSTPTSSSVSGTTLTSGSMTLSISMINSQDSSKHSDDGTDVMSITWIALANFAGVAILIVAILFCCRSTIRHLMNGYRQQK